MKFVFGMVIIIVLGLYALTQWKAANDQNEPSMKELRRLLALDRQQIIADCCYVSATKDGDYIVTVHPDESYDHVLGSVRVSPDGKVLSNSLPDRLTFDQLMSLTRSAKDWQEKGRQKCRQSQ